MRDSRGPWYLLTGLAIGAVLGVLYAWGVQPVNIKHPTRLIAHRLQRPISRYDRPRLIWRTATWCAPGHDSTFWAMPMSTRCWQSRRSAPCAIPPAGQGRHAEAGARPGSARGCPGTTGRHGRCSCPGFPKPAPLGRHTLVYALLEYSDANSIGASHPDRDKSFSGDVRCHRPIDPANCRGENSFTNHYSVLPRAPSPLLQGRTFALKSEELACNPDQNTPLIVLQTNDAAQHGRACRV